MLSGSLFLDLMIILPFYFSVEVSKAAPGKPVAIRKRSEGGAELLEVDVGIKWFMVKEFVARDDIESDDLFVDRDVELWSCDFRTVRTYNLHVLSDGPYSIAHEEIDVQVVYSIATISRAWENAFLSRIVI